MGENAKQKIKARDSYKEFAERESGCQVGDLNDSQKSRQLGWFFLSKIYSPLHREISIEDFEDGWVDGAKDLDVDFLHRDDGKVLILQCRYHGTSYGSEKARDIERFQSVLSRLANDEFKANEKLNDIAKEIEWENDAFELIYVTFADIAGQALDQSELAPKLPSKDGIEDRVEYQFNGETQLNELLRQSLSTTSGISEKKITLVAVSDKATGSRTGVVEFTSGEHKSCLMVVDAPQLVNAYKHHKDSLFSMNIRNFLGSTRQNKKIIETAVNSPDDFFYFNNGISCIAESFSVNGDRIEASRLQIINGAQTVKALYKATGRSGLPASWRDHPPHVLVRITEVSGKGYGVEGRFRNEITRFNNTQNVIKDADFRSNDPIHESIAAKFEKNSHQGKKVVYQAKRTDVRQANTEIIRVEEFSKRVFSFLVDPISFSGSTSMLFDESKGYAHVFGDGNSTWLEIPEDEFRLRAAIWWLSECFADEMKTDKALKTRSAEDQRIYLHSLERKWHILFAARLVLDRAFGADRWRSRVEKLYKGDWRAGEVGDGAFVNSLYQLSRQTVVTVYRRAAKDASFNHRQWMRSRQTVEELRAHSIDMTDDLVAPLLKGA